MAFNFGSAFSNIVNQVTQIGKETKTELEEEKHDVQEEEDEVTHLQKAQGIIDRYSGVEHLHNPDDVRTAINTAEEHLEKARREETEIIEDHEREEKQGKEKIEQIEEVESELEKMKSEL